jgi:hypothetical protein
MYVGILELKLRPSASDLGFDISKFEVPLSDNRWKHRFSWYFGGVPDSYFALRRLFNISFKTQLFLTK